MLLRGELLLWKNPNFENFESALYSTSGNMPLTGSVIPNHQDYQFEAFNSRLITWVQVDIPKGYSFEKFRFRKGFILKGH